MPPVPDSLRKDLERRHRTAATAVGAMLGLTIALMGLGYLHKFPLIPASYSLAQGLWVTIAVFGLGSVALRRARFSAMRLQDIAALRGISGLLTTLQNTTLLLALMGGVVAIMGFINTMMTNDWIHIRNAGVIAIGILIYSYPGRSSWKRVVEGIQRKGIADGSTAKGNIT